MPKTLDKKSAAAVKKAAAKPRAGKADKVPETAENFEHILRRLVIARDKDRSLDRKM